MEKRVSCVRTSVHIFHICSVEEACVNKNIPIVPKLSVTSKQLWNCPSSPSSGFWNCLSWKLQTNSFLFTPGQILSTVGSLWQLLATFGNCCPVSLNPASHCQNCNQCLKEVKKHPIYVKLCEQPLMAKRHRLFRPNKNINQSRMEIRESLFAFQTSIVAGW